MQGQLSQARAPHSASHLAEHLQRKTRVLGSWCLDTLDDSFIPRAARRLFRQSNFFNFGGLAKDFINFNTTKNIMLIIHPAWNWKRAGNIKTWSIMHSSKLDFLTRIMAARMWPSLSHVEKKFQKWNLPVTSAWLAKPAPLKSHNDWISITSKKPWCLTC